MMHRSGRWRRLLDPASRYIEPRPNPGGFPRRYPPTSNEGFAEGSSAQYSWMVPFDPHGLAARIGGRGKAIARLSGFLRILNDVRRGFHSSHALLGNEPSLGAPWLFDWLRRPYLTQRAVRRGVTELFGPGPAGLPGQDDLGELSSWYVLAALGMYPEVPGVGLLAVSTPLFPREEIRLPDGEVRIAAPHAGARGYIRGLRLDGRRYGRPWISYCSIAGGAHLRFGLTGQPDRRWGATASDRPPSFGPAGPAPTGPCP
jgi:putative alpha-1,2-mannosidase